MMAFGRNLSNEFEQSFLIEAPMLLHCGPLLFVNSRNPLPTDVAANATFGLVDTGKMKVMVTCEHVWEEFVKYRDTTPGAEIALLLGQNRPVILPNIKPIDSDADLDLATFDMQPFLEFCENRKFYRLESNAITSVGPKDIVTILGYVSQARQLSEVGANFRYEFIGVSAADVSGFRSNCSGRF